MVFWAEKSISGSFFENKVNDKNEWSEWLSKKLMKIIKVDFSAVFGVSK